MGDADDSTHLRRRSERNKRPNCMLAAFSEVGEEPAEELVQHGSAGHHTAAAAPKPKRSKPQEAPKNHLPPQVPPSLLGAPPAADAGGMGAGGHALPAAALQHTASLTGLLQGLQAPQSYLALTEHGYVLVAPPGSQPGMPLGVPNTSGIAVSAVGAPTAAAPLSFTAAPSAALGRPAATAPAGAGVPRPQLRPDPAAGATGATAPQAPPQASPQAAPQAAPQAPPQAPKAPRAQQAAAAVPNPAAVPSPAAATVVRQGQGAAAAGVGGSAQTVQLDPSTHTVPGQEAVTRLAMMDELLNSGDIKGEQQMEEVMAAGMKAIDDALDSLFSGVLHLKTYLSEDVYLEIKRYFGLEGSRLKREIVEQIRYAVQAEEDRRAYLPKDIIPTSHEVYLVVGGQLAAKSMLLRYGGDHHFKTLPLHVAQLHSLTIVDAAAASHIKIIISDEEANLVAEESSVADVRGGSIICVDRKFVVEAAAWDAAAARATDGAPRQLLGAADAAPYMGAADAADAAAQGAAAADEQQRAWPKCPSCKEPYAPNRHKCGKCTMDLKTHKAQVKAERLADRDMDPSKARTQFHEACRRYNGSSAGMQLLVMEFHPKCAGKSLRVQMNAYGAVPKAVEQLPRVRDAFTVFQAATKKYDEKLKEAKENAVAARAMPQTRFNSVEQVLAVAEVEAPTAAELKEKHGVKNVSDLVRCSEQEMREVLGFLFADAKRVHAALQ